MLIPLLCWPWAAPALAGPVDSDGDGVCDAEEDWDGDGDPTNDDLNDNGVPDYLDDRVPLDVDGDGYVSADWGGDDCDDGSISIYPGAFDPWYDGADWDCAGDDDFDADGDGFRSALHTPDGDDCDDADPSIFPGAEEALDAVDRDCDGWTDPTRPLVPVGGCDCRHGGAGGGLGLLWLAGLLARRRR